jgi:hypothetical protein
MPENNAFLLAEQMHDIRLPRDVFNLTDASYGFSDEPLQGSRMSI